MKSIGANSVNLLKGYLCLKHGVLMAANCVIISFTVSDADWFCSAFSSRNWSALKAIHINNFDCVAYSLSGLDQGADTMPSKARSKAYVSSL